jgi:hypothetical protein
MKLFKIQDGYNYFIIAGDEQEALNIYETDIGLLDNRENVIVEEMFDTLAISIYFKEENDTLTKTPSEWVDYFNAEPGLAFTEGGF